jgi:hypothetical protein
VSNLAVHFSSQKEDWATPDSLFAQLNEEFGPFTLDVAASHDNAKCALYFTQESDALVQDWLQTCIDARGVLQTASAPSSLPAQEMGSGIPYANLVDANTQSSNNGRVAQILSSDCACLPKNVDTAFLKKVDSGNVTTPGSLTTTSVEEEVSPFHGVSSTGGVRSGYGSIPVHTAASQEWNSNKITSYLSVMQVALEQFGATLYQLAAHVMDKKPANTREHGLRKLNTNEFAAYCNPPYNRKIAGFLAKAKTESARGLRCVFLLPARTDTRWYHQYVRPIIDGEEVGLVRFLRGRVTFKGAKHPAPFPSMVVVFDRPAVSSLAVQGP